MNYYLLSIKI